MRSDPVAQRLLGEIVPRLDAETNQAASVARADFEAVGARTRAVTFVIFFISVAVGIVVALRLSTYLVRRLSDLGRGADIIGEVNLQHRIAVEPRDEMGELAEHFNEMAANLDVAQTRLQGANEQLAELNRLLTQRIEEELAKVQLAARIQRDLLPRHPRRSPATRWRAVRSRRKRWEATTSTSSRWRVALPCVWPTCPARGSRPRC
jgi:HAMP domain-containing protein